MSVITETYAKDKQLSKNFMLSEFLCKDGTKTIKYSTDLVAMLQQIIDKSELITTGKVNSGYRTPAYSVEVGGTKNDAHTVGIAADMQFKDANKKVIPPKYIACLAQDMGFGGIGVMSNSIHLDVRHLGGYSNKKWWGDETKDYSLSKNGTDFYKYYNLTKEKVYEYLKIPLKKSISAIVQEVLDGKWGTGATRKAKLTDAGYNYSEVQAAVNAEVNRRAVNSVPRK